MALRHLAGNPFGFGMLCVMAEHNSLGKWGEDVVVEYLVKGGYAIVERNWRSNHHEVDIIATQGDMIAFVEVKTRRDKESNPLDAMTRAKIRNLVNAANAYLRVVEQPLRPRFDVALVCGEPHDFKIEYLKDAFYPPLRTYR